ncbi:hypothetical protein GLAREA_12701 [Glarea lozoyensis ATCC 20868]|uniref:Uncharacterized protein n=1 Tax=Glarea lozoyensis (strain ATCC 20868 / MF5171) TaxID=1116229 RepID=S3DYG8_GLAL2|nr:uncharacterized protein GLAREA_12701 [Glarea lozoyensis ATCC 20868]EPE31398.1 hypothetical protein GLAREA_12701 [Glarea lozoyensis ATCC 20868]
MADQLVAPLLEIHHQSSANPKSAKSNLLYSPTSVFYVDEDKYSAAEHSKSCEVLDYSVGVLHPHILDQALHSAVSIHTENHYEMYSDHSSTLVLTPTTSSESLDDNESPITVSSTVSESEVKRLHSTIPFKIPVLHTTTESTNFTIPATTPSKPSTSSQRRNTERKPIIHQSLPPTQTSSNTNPEHVETYTTVHLSSCHSKERNVPWQLYKWLAATDYGEVSAAERVFSGVVVGEEIPEN